MPRRYITQLAPQEKVNEIFRVVSKQMRTNRSGILYLQVDLADRTGTITALRWNAVPEDAQAFEPGDYVRVEGTTQVYQGGLQLIAKRFSRVRRSDGRTRVRSAPATNSSGSKAA